MCKVHVEYCINCGLRPECEKLKKFIEAQVPTAKILCQNGRQGAFEVTINEKLVYSKRKQGLLPDFNAILEQVKAAHNKQPINEVTQGQNNCSIS